MIFYTEHKGGDDYETITLEEWCDTHQTSKEIAWALYDLAEGDGAEIERLWQEPSAAEQLDVIRRAFAKVPAPDLHDTRLYWGDNGACTWAETKGETAE